MRHILQEQDENGREELGEMGVTSLDVRNDSKSRSEVYSCLLNLVNVKLGLVKL